MSSRILIIDDEPDYLELLKGLLNQEGYDNVSTLADPHKAKTFLSSNKVDLVILDIYMPAKNGLEVLEEITADHPSIPVIMVTAVDNIDIALRAIKLGAYDYIIKPPDMDRLLLTIKRALDNRLLQLERDTLRTTAGEPTGYKDFSGIISASPKMRKVFDLVQIFAPTDETILICGETGTGKDLIAHKIHEISSRYDKQFVVVNLASITPSLFESELFGHEKGSFTGAQSDRKGFFEEANGGTLFLDEIGELPKELQGKLLRTIQYQEIYRIGSSKPIKLNIRIIAATNKNLLEAVNKKEFRADLYYRLGRGYIELPPLRERKGDIVLLAYYFLKIGNAIYKKNIPGFTQEALHRLKCNSFPGNIRELENVILNSVAQSPGDKDIEKIEFPNQGMDIPSGKNDDIQLLTIDEAEEAHIKRIMSYTLGNTVKAAYILGVSERTLQRKLQKIRENRGDLKGFTPEDYPLQEAK